MSDPVSNPAPSPVVVHCDREGEPDLAATSTSYVEQSNLTIRMGSWSFTRLTSGFSKRLENHVHAVALHFWWYNLGRKHPTLTTTLAVPAGIAAQSFSMLDLVQTVEDEQRKLGGRLTDDLPASC